MWTKRQLIEQAYAEIGLANYVYDLPDDDLQSSLKRMDTMIAAWDGKGIKIGYLLPNNPSESLLTQDSGVPDWALEAIYTNLAIKIAPSLGKQVLPETKATAVRSLNSMLSKLNEEPLSRYMPSTMPIGAGYKTHNYSPFYEPNPDNIGLSGSETLEL